MGGSDHEERAFEGMPASGSILSLLPEPPPYLTALATILTHHCLSHSTIPFPLCGTKAVSPKAVDRGDTAQEGTARGRWAGFWTQAGSRGPSCSSECRYALYWVPRGCFCYPSVILAAEASSLLRHPAPTRTRQQGTLGGGTVTVPKVLPRTRPAPAPRQSSKYAILSIMACCSCSQPSGSHPKNPFLLTSSLLLRCSKMSRAENKVHGSLPSVCCLLLHQQLLPSICLYHLGPNLAPTWAILLFAQLSLSILN